MSKYFYPNWTSPLKIRNWHFETLENAIEKSFEKSNQIHLNPWDSGLCSNDLDIKETESEIIVKKCQVILATGQFIHIHETVPSLSIRKEDIKNQLGFSATEGYLLVTILPEKIPFGERDNENFGHLRYRIPNYQLSVVKDATGWSKHTFLIAKVKKQKDGVCLDNNYIPPLRKVRASTPFFEFYRAYTNQLKEQSETIEFILKTIELQPHKDSLTKDIRRYADKLSLVMDMAMIENQSMMMDRSPIYMFLQLKKMVKVTQRSFVKWAANQWVKEELMIRFDTNLDELILKLEHYLNLPYQHDALFLMMQEMRKVLAVQEGFLHRIRNHYSIVKVKSTVETPSILEKTTKDWGGIVLVIMAGLTVLFFTYHLLK